MDKQPEQGKKNFIDFCYEMRDILEDDKELKKEMEEKYPTVFLKAKIKSFLSTDTKKATNR